MEKGKIVFISWAPYCSRSDNIARELNGKSFMVYYSFLGSNYFTIVIKYSLQIIKTLGLLLKEKPQVVFCMTPPIFTSIPAWIYTKIKKNTGYILDYHTAAFVMKIYQKFFFIQRFFAKRALLNIVTNPILAETVKRWGGEIIIIGDVKVEYDKIVPYNNFKNGFNIVFVGRYSNTEPIEIVFKAASELKTENVYFYVTGSLKEADKDVIKQKPENVYLTDFLSDSEYAGLLKDADAVMSLCTNDNTMQRGAYEAMALETPLIVSDWQLLKDTFSCGTVYVKNERDSIVDGVKNMKKNYTNYKKGIKELKKIRSNVWQEKIETLEKKINFPH